MEFTKEQMSKALDKAYKKAGHNAYFANGFEAGVVFAEQQFKILNIPVVSGSLPTDLEIETEFPVDNNWAIEDRTHAIGKRQGAKWMRDKVSRL